MTDEYHIKTPNNTEPKTAQLMVFIQKTSKTEVYWFGTKASLKKIFEA